MLSVRQIEVRYEGIAAVRGISFDLAAGECLALIGPNGAGKSSTLRAISGLARVSSGAIMFSGSDISGLRAHQIARLGIAHVPEGRHIFGPMTVEDNLLLGRQRMGDLSPSQGLEMVYDILPKLQERRGQQAGSLSGGEQQMVVIGRAIIGQPKLLMLDEPSMGLAPQIVDTVFELLGKLRSAGQTILLVEQNAELAMDFAQRCVVLGVGEVQLTGTSAELRSRQDIIDAYLGTF
ncbi:ABC transporter ATP-binding protein [Manganibacter manganicus]|uniref:ABC transporter ATP-binding protein n=1 Tax=Manganibacter manganicus TaxID=1873176 RepID=A0A1V8RSE7_9HYPH|nr:ABC transporter ATP-binding protein [Pseudaminobacter manganicus]OQM76058.1 ABC transporter ATP-binding protein [Pseudaminobacter manganicus]